MIFLCFFLFFVVCCFACDLIWICFLGGFQGDVWVRKWINVKKDLKLHSYEKKNNKRLIFMEFFWRKKQQPVAKWWSFSMFSYIFFFFCVFFLSSFKVNLKVHYRNWRVILLLVPTGKSKQKQTNKQKEEERGPEAVAPVSLRNKTTSKQFWIKTVWSILDSLSELSNGFYIFQAV